ncbi:MAG: hypothetical protein QOD99_1604 [Chthoniobacter sp.]|nr:hypothetical protein [Chthoniobacter sp.]
MAPQVLMIFIMLAETKASPSLSVAQAKALKRKLRTLRWQPEAVMREILLIQRLRELLSAK